MSHSPSTTAAHIGRKRLAAEIKRKTLRTQTRTTRTVGAVKNTPNADNLNRLDERLRRRAALVELYAGLLGVTATRSDVLEDMRRTALPNAIDEADMIARSLTRWGLLSRVHRAQHCGAVPGLGFMISGQVLLVLGADHGTLEICDTTRPAPTTEPLYPKRTSRLSLPGWSSRPKPRSPTSPRGTRLTSACRTGSGARS